MPYANPEQRREYCRKRYANDPVYREKALARAKKRDQAKINAYKRKWRQRPDVKKRERIAFNAYRATRVHYFLSKSAEWRARCRGTKTEPVNYTKVIDAANGVCGICRQELRAPIDIDHIIPLSKGGTHTYNNLQATHSGCNRRKSNKLDYQPEGRR